MDVRKITTVGGVMFGLICLSVGMARVDGQVTFPGGNPQGSITNVNGAMAGVTAETPITLTKPCTKIQVYSSTGASNLFCDFNNVAAATGPGNTTEVFGGGSETYVGAPIKQFKMIADGGTGTYCVVGNNLAPLALLFFLIDMINLTKRKLADVTNGSRSRL